MYYTQKFVPHPFFGGNISSQHNLFVKIIINTVPLVSTFSPFFIFRYWQVYRTDATFDANKQTRESTDGCSLKVENDENENDDI